MNFGIHLTIEVSGDFAHGVRLVIKSVHIH